MLAKEKRASRCEWSGGLSAFDTAISFHPKTLMYVDPLLLVGLLRDKRMVVCPAKSQAWTQRFEAVSRHAAPVLICNDLFPASDSRGDKQRRLVASPAHYRPNDEGRESTRCDGDAASDGKVRRDHRHKTEELQNDTRTRLVFLAVQLCHQGLLFTRHEPLIAHFMSSDGAVAQTPSGACSS
jgi:hypothetical protein